MLLVRGTHLAKGTSLILLLFLVGILSGVVLEKTTGFDLVMPLGHSPERPSPQNWVDQDDIRVYDDRVVINVDQPYWSTFLDTNSMDPLLDIGANGIQIAPKNESQIEVGDVITYDRGQGMIIHRVVEIGSDTFGWYAIVQGDNNDIADPVRVRFEDVRRVLIAIIY
jgi:hypothetical protein